MASPSGLDPREVLGIGPHAGPDEITAAYRREAKRWHPDRADEHRAADRMALVNAAYAELRQATEAAGNARPSPAPSAGPARPSTLDAAVRRSLGDELGGALEPGEAVQLVTATATWASPQSFLVVTDRRLVWLLDDAPVHRVRSIDRSDVRRVYLRPARFWRGASVTVEDRRGRRQSFGELPAPTAEALVRRMSPQPRTTRRRSAG